MNTMAEQLRTQLSDLVRTRRAELRLSLRGMADLCVDPETGRQIVKYSWIDRLEKRLPVIPPQVPELLAMARALRLPERMVQEAAAAQFMGVDNLVEWSSDGSVRIVVARMHELTEQERRDFADIAERYARRTRPED